MGVANDREFRKDGEELSEKRKKGKPWLQEKGEEFFYGQDRGEEGLIGGIGDGYLRVTPQMKRGGCFSAEGGKNEEGPGTFLGRTVEG